ncbi:MAG: glycoside hydrolase family 3 C-terminal domain-containing protein [Clostridia bacterium]|nr:glycoside hydrolase family 3 C-terminal domain-containing protein [Clostridia bacterium]
MSLDTVFEKLVTKVREALNLSPVMQRENAAKGEKVIFEDMPEKARAASEESIVLLKNDNDILPVKAEQTIAVFGRCQHDWFYVGYGSGGDVHAPYYINMIEGLKNNGVKLYEPLAEEYAAWSKAHLVNHGIWGHWPMNYPEMKISADSVEAAAKGSDLALVVIGRAAGEDRENILKEGSFYLTQAELDLLELVTAHFSRVAVILNCGNIFDMQWTEKYGDRISAIVSAWLCGMESGNALANVLCGKVSPSGKLPCAIARSFEDYPSSADFGGKEFNNYKEDIFVGYRYFETFCPEKVLFPFGFGLSYTKFEIEAKKFTQTDAGFVFVIEVKNTGKCSGKEVVQLYLSAPQGKLKKAKMSLIAFAKTKLLAPGESEGLTLSCSLYDIASFDDTGKTGNKFAYVLEQGEYRFYAGNNVRTDTLAGSARLAYTVVEQLGEVCGVKNAFERLTVTEKNGSLLPAYEAVEASAPYLKDRILENLPAEIGFQGDKGHTFDEVAEGNITLDTFISQLDNKELEALTRGQGMIDSKCGVAGNTGAYCGIIPSLQQKGVPPIITTDGPAGIRIKQYTSLIPCGTALASTFNCALVEALTTVTGRELVAVGSDVLLAPGMNIQRNVLCGRNFEYFSEDPLLSGKMGAAYIRGVQSAGASACPKHLACNNQETNRTKSDSRVSQRALREIYLKGFEIAVKEGKPLNVMTSYNKVNGVWSHYNYDLVTTVLRGEWGYDGCVMTDWWMQKSASPEFPKIKDNAYRVRAQVDVLMPGGKYGTKRYVSDGTLLPTLGKEGGITRAELERTAKNVLKLALRLKFGFIE